MPNNESYKSNKSNKPNTQYTGSVLLPTTLDKATEDSMTNKANRCKAVPDKRERHDGPGGE